MDKFKDPLFVAFGLYLGKVLAFGMSIQESIFMSLLVGIQVYREYLKHKEVVKTLEVQAEVTKKLSEMENRIKEMESKVAESSQAVLGMSLLKRPR